MHAAQGKCILYALVRGCFRALLELQCLVHLGKQKKRRFLLDAGNAVLNF